MAIRILIILLLLQTTLYGYSEQDTEDKVMAVVKRHQYQLLKRIPYTYDVRILNQLPICHYYCEFLKTYLDSETNLVTQIVHTQGHSYILTADDIVIDPTFRQFFTYAPIDQGFAYSKIPRVFDLMHVPRVLVVARDKLFQAFYSFGLTPNWLAHPLDCALTDQKLVCNLTKYDFDYYYK